MDVKDDGFLTLLMDDGSLKEDLRLPDDEDSIPVVDQIKEMFAADKEVYVSVISALGKEKVVGCRESNKWVSHK